MGLLNTFQEWASNRHEKMLANMESKGFCPDCRGKGINHLALSEYYYSTSIECPGCNGSGTYTDWASNSK
ncbi:MAG: methionine aminopeptidase [Heyndrickxia oleronia]|jgi:DnaJ-class molecular chaperone|uniref:methionine aminopeptidase n=2 Tax=Heyndrickxia oleronia TaxID=38875 RepID=UPI00242A4BEE|nr:methionine aminopeptidase [Heyndrickxia oleronia]MCI1592713.1 methionine aminopeptidase [Heyndrickxia oleronia]MCI1614212.1 methionine aminopeptidase [Heyndrickxia oleronia]